MTVIRLFVISFLLTHSSYSQSQKLIAFQKKIDAKVAVGMSTNEVKAALGRPKAIEGGFPNSNELVIADLPNQAGQLNNSTWFYFYPLLVAKADQPLYVVNGFPVSKEDYDAYEKSNEVYIYDGKVIHPGMGDGYKSLNDPKLKIRPKDPRETYRSTKSNRSFIPVFCIIFDKGTQVVASTKMFFKIVVD